MALPALAALRAGMPKARLTVVGRWAPLLSGQGVADVLLGYPRPARERAAILRALRKEPVELAVLLPNSFESALAAWCWRARRRLGFEADSRRLLLTDAVPLPSPRAHQVDEYLLLVSALGIAAPGGHPVFQRVADAERESEVTALLSEAGADCRRPPVGLHLGAAGGSAKQWPVASFARLVLRLRDSGATPLLLGGPEDVGRAAQVCEAVGWAAPSLVGRDRPALLPHLLVRLSSLVSGDTGVAHLAAALGVPTVTLFGPTDARLTAPRGPAARVMAGEAPCAPCFLPSCPIDHVCLRSLAADAVADEVLQVAAL